MGIPTGGFAMAYSLVILCGGGSSRMGSDKALLPFGDYCLIEYLVRKFKPYFPKIYLSVKKKGDYAHLNLDVTEIPDIYPNAGPMSGIFSGLSMMDEETAFFMSVDTPFLDPQTGAALLDAIEDSDICAIRGKAGCLETSTAAYSKNCITSIGKCLLLRQFTFKTLREKCRTKYLTPEEVSGSSSLPLDIQFYNLDTRPNYYHALHMLSGIYEPDSSNALIEYFNDNKDLFWHTIPTLSFVSKPGTILNPFFDRLLPILKRDGLDVLFLTLEDKNLILHDFSGEPVIENLTASISGSDLLLIEYTGLPKSDRVPNKIEVLHKGWSETPITAENELLGIAADFPYEDKSGVPVFDMNKPKGFVSFIHEFLNAT